VSGTNAIVIRSNLVTVVEGGLESKFTSVQYFRAMPVLQNSLLPVYDLPIWLFGFLTVAATVAVGLAGFYTTRKRVRRVQVVTAVPPRFGSRSGTEPDADCHRFFPRVGGVCRLR
jgi:hypothetical protein